MNPSEILNLLAERGVEFREPGLLWALLLVPALLIGYVAARRQRRRVAGAFRVTRVPARRPLGPRIWRALALVCLLAGLATLVTGFARPVVPLATPDDRATVIVVLDTSTAMRATDVAPTRIQAAQRAARTAIQAVPDRLQVALVAYSRTPYLLQAPTHDHGAAALAVDQARTAEGAAPGDAIAVALATVPLHDPTAGGGPPSGSAGGAGANPPAAAPGGSAPPAGGASGNPAGAAPAARVPAVVVLVSTGAADQGRPAEQAAGEAAGNGVPVYVVPIGPARGEVKAPFDPSLLARVAQASGGRVLTAPTARDWRRIYDQVGSDVIVERKPQEVGHFAGAAGLVATGLAMLVSLVTSRRLF